MKLTIPTARITTFLRTHIAQLWVLAVVAYVLFIVFFVYTQVVTVLIAPLPSDVSLVDLQREKVDERLLHQVEQTLLEKQQLQATGLSVGPDPFAQ